MARKYISLGIRELEAMYKGSPSDQTLTDLEEELRHRTTDKALELHKKVVRTIKDRKRRQEQTVNSAPSYVQQPLFEQVPPQQDTILVNKKELYDLVERLVEQKVQENMRKKMQEISLIVETFEKTSIVGKVSPLAKIIIERLSE